MLRHDIDNYFFLKIYKCPTGNTESYECMMSTLVRQAALPEEFGLGPDTIVYLVEVGTIYAQACQS